MNPLLTLIVQATESHQVDAVACERRDDGRWVATVTLSGMTRHRDEHLSVDPEGAVVSAAEADSIYPAEAPTITAMTWSKPKPHQCLLPPGTSSEVVETWMIEVAEIGNSRDVAMTRDGRRYLTLPVRWGCDYRKRSAEQHRTGYLLGPTWPHRKALKQQGLRWAPTRKAWYGPLALCRQLADDLDLILWTKPPALKLMA